MTRITDLSPVSLRGIAAVRTVLLPGQDIALPDVAVYSSAPAGSRVRELTQRAFAARTAHLHAVELVSLPVGATVHGPAYFALTIDGTSVSEQIAPWFKSDCDALERALKLTTSVQEVDEPIVLIARYGDATWGHWLDELLPKIVLVETRYPGEFRYAVPNWLLTDGPNIVPRRMRESLAAYRIGTERLFPMRTDVRYAFRHLHAVTSIWSDRMIHPGGVAAMQAHIAAMPRVDLRSGQAALLRGDNNRRQISNWTEVSEYLERRDFQIFDVALMPFGQQVALFRHAQTIFTILGSTLAGSLYAGDGTGVVASAPDEFVDDFFYAILRLKRGRYAEVRGSLNSGSSVYEKSSFYVPVECLGRALDAVVASPVGESSSLWSHPRYIP